MHLSLLSLSVLVSYVLASPTGNHIIHEKRDATPMGWSKGGRLDRRALIPMKIALTQRNIDMGADYLHEVSHPASAKYGQHWTAQEVADHFAPSEETISSVMDWLIASGISSDSVKLSKGKNWINYEASVDQAESLLNTKYHLYEHDATGHPHIGCDEYSVPKHLKDHIDFVTPSLHFDARITERSETLEKRDVTPDTGKTIGQPGSWSTPHLGQYINKSQFIKELEQCDEQITPNCLKALYKIPKSTGKSVKNSYGIVEYTPQAYVPSDLDLFFANFSEKQVGDRPITDLIDGAVVQQTNMSFNFNGESNLDLEYAMTLIYPEKVTLLQVGDLVEGASFNNLLDAIDASYCSYEGGDDPSQDGIYPDVYAGGYKGKEDCGTFAPPKVISTSYGYNEADLTPFYEKRQCDEYMKLGLMGTSVLYSSGDYGVAGNGGQCLNANGTYNSGKTGRFNPSFPATCPYVTAVGATQVIPGTNIITSLASGTQPEEACETVIYSGGGFSNVFPLPSYQSSAVKSWFKNYPPPYGADRFNNTQKTRGFPDVSANGANYVVAIDGTFALVYGTSASSPTFGSILTIINERRLQAGKSSIGFINPTLYAHPEVLNDVTQGGNQGCGTPGFTASKGWDPVTGLGTPDSVKMLALFLSLP
ncbi:subtilisin-like protein [Aureobasidium sp. EXF-12298]|nr:subtilisin-like protein [Aureobasidium sp. EXF-12298]KAI4752180.1 subtilisin-like protein [Aureobasidium sp. EXF-12344]KAI4768866.1 subtilisin-like protein [Aureobasidium sp. EXF-3400]